MSFHRPHRPHRLTPAVLLPLPALVFALLLALALAPAPARAATSLDLWPLAEFSPERTTVLYPFYLHEGDFLMVFPFYYRTYHARDHHLLWPLVKFSEGRLTRLMPSWYSADADTFTAFPFVRHTPRYTFWTLPPLYLRHDRSFTALFPFYARSPETLWLLPLYHHHSGETRTWNLVPLFFSERAPGRAIYDVPYVFEYERYPNGVNFWLIPFSLHRSAESRGSAIVPLFAWKRAGLPAGDKTFLWLFPFARARSPKKSFTAVLPLYLKTWKQLAEGEAKNFWLLPFVRGTAPASAYHGLLPLYLYKSKAQGPNRRQTLNLLWPLYRREILKTPEGQIQSYHRRFLIFSDAKSPTGTRTFKLLGVPVVERTQ